MPRLCTRLKRYKALGSTHQQHRLWKGTGETKRRMKSFKTEAAAKDWAQRNKLDEKTHELRKLKTKWQWRVAATRNA